jgi:hypothetical protein
MSATTIYWFIAFLAMAAWNVYINEHWYKRAIKCDDEWYKLAMKNNEEWAELCRKIEAERDALKARVAELEEGGNKE